MEAVVVPDSVKSNALATSDRFEQVKLLTKDEKSFNCLTACISLGSSEIVCFKKKMAALRGLVRILTAAAGFSFSVSQNEIKSLTKDNKRASVEFETAFGERVKIELPQFGEKFSSSIIEKIRLSREYAEETTDPNLERQKFQDPPPEIGILSNSKNHEIPNEHTEEEVISFHETLSMAEAGNELEDDFNLLEAVRTAESTGAEDEATVAETTEAVRPIPHVENRTACGQRFSGSAQSCSVWQIGETKVTRRDHRSKRTSSRWGKINKKQDQSLPENLQENKMLQVFVANNGVRNIVKAILNSCTHNLATDNVGELLNGFRESLEDIMSTEASYKQIALYGEKGASHFPSAEGYREMNTAMMNLVKKRATEVAGGELSEDANAKKICCLLCDIDFNKNGMMSHLRHEHCLRIRKFTCVNPECHLSTYDSTKAKNHGLNQINPNCSPAKGIIRYNDAISQLQMRLVISVGCATIAVRR